MDALIFYNKYITRFQVAQQAQKPQKCVISKTGAEFSINVRELGIW